MPLHPLEAKVCYDGQSSYKASQREFSAQKAGYVTLAEHPQRL